jgi:hypothetical protein
MPDGELFAPGPLFFSAGDLIQRRAGKHLRPPIFILFLFLYNKFPIKTRAAAVLSVKRLQDRIFTAFMHPRQRKTRASKGF